MATVSPHFDRHIAYIPNKPPMGWRDGWASQMVREGQRLKGNAKQGFLGALYHLRASSLPGAYLRDEDTARFQEMICEIISAIQAPDREVESDLARRCGLAREIYGAMESR